MSATDTATRVLNWAVAGRGGPPRGDLRAAEALAEPDSDLRAALVQAVVVTAARLRLGDPPLGDDQPLSANAAVIAAAVGCLWNPRLALALVGSLSAGAPPPNSPREWLANHAIVHRVLPFLPESRPPDLPLLTL